MVIGESVAAQSDPLTTYGTGEEASTWNERSEWCSRSMATPSTPTAKASPWGLRPAPPLPSYPWLITWLHPWAHGPNGPIGPKASGPMDPWAHGPHIPYCHGLIAQWSSQSSQPVSQTYGADLETR